MAENRFKKSIDSATYNTIDIAKESIETSIKTNIETTVKDNIKDSIKSNVLETVQYNIKNNTSLEVNKDTLKIVFDKDKKDKGSNHTIYLSAGVGGALNRLAKKTKQSKSTLVNDILETVFKGNGLL